MSDACRPSHNRTLISPPLCRRCNNKELPQLAYRIYRWRRFRDQIFGNTIFGEPAFDMLLDLYAWQMQGRRISVSSLVLASTAPSTTALRYITLLQKEGLIYRTADPHDKRRHFLWLTPTALDLMERVLIFDGAMPGEAVSRPTRAADAFAHCRQNDLRSVFDACPMSGLSGIAEPEDPR